MSRSFLLEKCKKDLLTIYDSAIKAVKPENLIKNAVSIENNRLIVKNDAEINIDITTKNLHLIGGGKSVMAMAKGLAEVAYKSTDLFSHGCLSVPEKLRTIYNTQFKPELDSIKTEVCFGSQDNLPDECSVQGSKRILNFIEQACEHDRATNREPLFIVLLSGGGSACLTYPKFVDLEKKLELIKYLVHQGADIVELNKVRRYFSQIKGGQLAKYILRNHKEAKLITLILSDVIGDPIEYIASGPTYFGKNPDENHKRSMLEVLMKYKYPKLSELVEVCEEKEDLQVMTNAQKYGEVVMNRIIGNNSIALREARTTAESMGYSVIDLGNKLEGYTDQVVNRFLESGRNIQAFTSDLLFLGGGEPTIHKRAGETWGKGGRAQEMCLDYLISRIRVDRGVSDGITDVFLAGTTDGQDGPTDVAACMVSFSECLMKNKLEKLELELMRAKSSHDSNTFWSTFDPGCLIKTGLTGTNVMDIYLYALKSEVKSHLFKL